jgi:hypothetical protein
MSTAPTIAPDRESTAAPRPAQSLAAALFAHPLLVALAIIAVTVAIRAQGTVDGDVAWQLWIARQLNHGAHLYRDIVETNPPLWFWMALPVDHLSALVQVRSDHVLVAVVGCAAALAIAATDRLTRTIAAPRRTLLLAYASLIVIAMPWVEIGQREHIALIGALPYAALIAARRCGRAVPVSLALAVGAGGALGFALKPYFLVVPVILECWLIACQRGRWRPLRPEIVAVAGVGVGYSVALLALAHDYLTVVLPVLLLAYGATGAKHWVDLFQPAVLTALASIVLLIANRRFMRSDGSGIAAALTLAAVGFTIAYFVQAKGWNYHAIPMLACAAIALAAALAAGANPPRLLLFTAPALLLLPFSIALHHAEQEPASTHDVARALAGVKSGEAVGLISTDPSFGWPAVLQRGLRFPLRYNGFWMMQAIVTNELRGGRDPRLTQLGRKVARETAADFECTPPLRIVVDRPTPEQARGGAFDILDFFMREPQFAALLSHYRPIQRTSVETFALAVPIPRPSTCPDWSPA